MHNFLRGDGIVGGREIPAWRESMLELCRQNFLAGHTRFGKTERFRGDDVGEPFS